MRATADSPARRSLADLLAFQRYVIVGANSGGDQVQAYLVARGKTVVAFADLAPNVLGGRRNGCEIVPFELVASLAQGRTAIVIATVRQREAAERLIGEAGIEPERIFPFVNPMFAAHYDSAVQAALQGRLESVRGWLSDAASRAYFDRVTAFYRTLDARWLTPNPSRRGHYGYDAPGANPRPRATIVDCGAFTGDTIDDFLAATGGDCNIFALEAFLPNMQRLLAKIEARGLKARVTPLHVAVAERQGAALIAGSDATPDGGATSLAQRAGRRDLVLAETIDNLFLTHFPTRIDYLKLDIEGADLDALRGGAQVLRKQRPVVAAAAYHRPEHVVEIAEFLVDALHPCRLYAAHDPDWVFHIHYIAVPNERT